MKSKKYTLPADFGKRWVEALRSGKYKQGKGTLFKDNSYCCLGVACLVHGVKDIPDTAWIRPEFNKFKGMPDILKGSANDSELVYKLSAINDHEEYTFKQIADWICDHVHFEPLNLTAKDTQARIEESYNKQGV